MKKIISILFLTALTVAIIEAQSSYLKFEGIEGEATERAYLGWSELTAFSQGYSSSAAVVGATRRRAIVNVEDLTCVKALDKSSPKLAEAALKGKVFPKVEIHMTRMLAGKGAQSYYMYELKNARISSYNISSSGNEVPMEEITISFAEIKVTYTEYDNRGNKKGNVEYSWKVEAGK
jgi:type VI secretion system secreted protein Hcp